ncbi:MAG TPA: SCO family protein [Terriglobales bacterium]|nr:SCO family protein [Terriglobales bacterium]
MITQDGVKVHFYDDLVRDRKVVINFMFTKCEKACPTITMNLVRVQKMLKERIGHDIFMYSISLRPEEDCPEVLKQYAKRHGVGPGWLFLTGKPEDIESLRHALGYVSLNPVRDADKTTHIGMLRYGNEPYMRWAACPGQAPADWVAISIVSEMDGPEKGAVKKNIATLPVDGLPGI